MSGSRSTSRERGYYHSSSSLNVPRWRWTTLPSPPSRTVWGPRHTSFTSPAARWWWACRILPWPPAFQSAARLSSERWTTKDGVKGLQISSEIGLLLLPMKEQMIIEHLVSLSSCFVSIEQDARRVLERLLCSNTRGHMSSICYARWSFHIAQGTPPLGCIWTCFMTRMQNIAGGRLV